MPLDLQEKAQKQEFLPNYTLIPVTALQVAGGGAAQAVLAAAPQITRNT